MLRACVSQADGGESRACVIVCETEPHRYLPGSEVWWDVAPPEVSNEPEAQKARREYERERAELQRFYY